MTTTVASSTGASSGPTTPPDTRKPNWPVAKPAAHALCASAYLKAAKNSTIGRKSNSSFIAPA